jgi:hypothetical protein
MKYNKLPITIPEQVEKLKVRGLKFDNETNIYAYNTLHIRVATFFLFQ